MKIISLEASFLIPAFTGSISAVSSSLIIYVIFRTEKKLSTIYHRIMLGMSCADILGSIAMALTTLPMPKEPMTCEEQTEDDLLNWSVLRLGNVQTCDAQGFFVLFGTVTMLSYNGMLCMYYVCAIAFQMSEDFIRRRIEPILHFIVLTLGFSQSLPPLFLHFYNASKSDPWCTLYLNPCRVGEDSEKYILIFTTMFVGMISFFLAVVLICFILLIRRAVVIDREIVLLEKLYLLQDRYSSRRRNNTGNNNNTVNNSNVLNNNNVNNNSRRNNYNDNNNTNIDDNNDNNGNHDNDNHNDNHNEDIIIVRRSPPSSSSRFLRRNNNERSVPPHHEMHEQRGVAAISSTSQVPPMSAELNSVTDAHATTKVIIVQSVAYYFALLLTISFSMIRLIVNKRMPTIEMFQHIFFPLQGFFNFLIFVSHKVYNYKLVHRNESYSSILYKYFVTGETNEPILLSRISLVRVHHQNADDAASADDADDSDDVIEMIDINDEDGQQQRFHFDIMRHDSDDVNVENDIDLHNELSYSSSTRRNNGNANDDALPSYPSSRNSASRAYTDDDDDNNSRANLSWFSRQTTTVRSNNEDDGSDHDGVLSYNPSPLHMSTTR